MNSKLSVIIAAVMVFAGVTTEGFAGAADSNTEPQVVAEAEIDDISEPVEEVVVEGPKGIAGPEGKRLIFPIPAVGTHGTTPKRCVIAPLRSRQAVRRRTS